MLTAYGEKCILTIIIIISIILFVKSCTRICTYEYVWIRNKLYTLFIYYFIHSGYCSPLVCVPTFHHMLFAYICPSPHIDRTHHWTWTSIPHQVSVGCWVTKWKIGAHVSPFRIQFIYRIFIHINMANGSTLVHYNHYNLRH